MLLPMQIGLTNLGHLRRRVGGHGWERASRNPGLGKGQAVEKGVRVKGFRQRHINTPKAIVNLDLFLEKRQWLSGWVCVSRTSKIPVLSQKDCNLEHDLKISPYFVLNTSLLDRRGLRPF